MLLLLLLLMLLKDLPAPPPTTLLLSIPGVGVLSNAALLFVLPPLPFPTLLKILSLWVSDEEVVLLLVVAAPDDSSELEKGGEGWLLLGRCGW